MGAGELPFTSAPYPGLRPFAAGESDIFFGREEQVDKLLEKLQHNRFLALVGASGCGKSSLVRAGLIAGLEAGYMGEAGHRWRVADLRPGNEPLLHLAEALLDPRALGTELAAGTSLAAAHAQLRRGPLGLVELVREARLPEGTNLLVLVDQFEEIFRFRRLGNPNAADAFVALLCESARCREQPVFIVLTMRSDFLGDCAVFRGLPEAISASEFLTPRLTREQIREAIVGPARMFGGDIDPALVNRLINDVGPDPDQLPVLQHALMRMWSRAQDRAHAPGQSPLITLEDYTAIGGLRTALSNHGDELLNGLSVERQRLAQTMFSWLTERGEGRRDTRRPATVREIAELARTDPAEVAAVADTFRVPGVSFLTPPYSVPLTPDSVLDISHESLIRVWAKLAAWVEQEAERASVYVRLKQAADLWKQGTADLYSGRQLSNARLWARAAQPTAAWALRYGTREEFDAVMAFFDASTRQNRKRRLGRVASAAALVLLVAGFAGYEYHRLEQEVAALSSVQRALRSVDMASVDGDGALLEVTRAACDYSNPVVHNSVARVLSSRQELHRMQAPQDSSLLALGYSQTRATVLIGRADGGAMLLRPAEGASHLLKLPPAFTPAAGAISSGASRAALLLTTGAQPPQLEIRVWDFAAQPELVTSLTPDAPLALIALDPLGRVVAGATADGRILMWDLANGVKRFEGMTPQPRFSEIAGLQYSADGQLLMIVGSDRPQAKAGTVRSIASDAAVVFDARTGAVIREVRAAAVDPYFTWSAALAPDGRRLATLAQNGTLEVHELASGRRTLSLGLRVQQPKGLTFFPDGNTVAVESWSGEVRIVGLDTMEDWALNDMGIHLLSAVPSPSGREVLAQEFDSSYRVLKMPRQPIDGTGADVRAAAFTADGKQLALGLGSGEVVLRSASDERGASRLGLAVPRNLQGSARPRLAPVSRLAFSPAGPQLAVAHEDGWIRIWNAQSRALSVELRHPETDASSSGIRCVAFSPDGNRMVSTGEDDTVRVWNVRDGSPIGAPVTRHRADQPKCAAFDGQGVGILAVTERGQLLHWHPGDERNMATIELHKNGLALDDRSVQQARFAPARDGTTMLAASGTLTGRRLPFTWVWELSPSGEPLAPLAEYAGQRAIGGFAANGTRVGTLDDRNTFTIWDRASGMKITSSPAERMAELSPAGDRMLIVNETGARFQDCDACGAYEQVWTTARSHAMAIAAEPSRQPVGKSKRDAFGSCKTNPASSGTVEAALQADRG